MTPHPSITWASNLYRHGIARVLKEYSLGISYVRSFDGLSRKTLLAGFGGPGGESGPTGGHLEEEVRWSIG